MAKRRKLSKSSLLWFIRSRPYALIPEIRRRFEMDDEDEVSVVHNVNGRLRAWVGLPQRAARLIEDLCHEGRVGVELNPSLRASVIVGIFAYDLARGDRTYAPGQPPPPEPADEDVAEGSVTG